MALNNTPFSYLFLYYQWVFWHKYLMPKTKHQPRAKRSKSSSGLTLGADSTSPAKKPKAYSYLRFSTADQIQGDSFRRQTELARAWCAKTGIPLVDNYRDLGVSAFRAANADNVRETGSGDKMEKKSGIFGALISFFSPDPNGTAGIGNSIFKKLPRPSPKADTIPSLRPSKILQTASLPTTTSDER